MALTENEIKLIKAIREIAKKGCDAEVRTTTDGRYKVFEVKKKIVVG